MRVSTANRYETAVDNLQRRQRDMAEAQTAMTNGKRINRPSDDPTGAARAERAYISGERIASEQRSLAASRHAMTLTEAALGQAGELLQGARDTLVAAGNGSYSAAERASQANQLAQLRSQLLALANQGNGAGGYLFGGQGATTIPFLDTAAGVQPAATGGQSELSTADAMPITVDGQTIWLAARSGNGVFVSAAAAANTGSGWIDAGTVTDPAAITGNDYTIDFFDHNGVLSYTVSSNAAPTALENVPYQAGAAITVDGMSLHVKGLPADGDRFTIGPATPDLDAFEALDRAIATLKDPASNPGRVAQAVNSGLRDLDAVMGHMQAARAAAGSTLTRLDTLDARNQDRALWARSVQADAEDLDMVQAVSTFQNQQTGYQAALQSYAMVQRLSLFDYVK
ncbi:MAG: flagellar hook-associated protein FlgL [Burkholderiaceae bacterium]|nr:flagellar hook-associated protein FlgL [Burkholderiaceae bacterium]